MAYLNTNEMDQYYGLIPGDSVPVELRTWPTSIRDGFFQVSRIDGNLSDTPYSFRNPNSQGYTASFGGNNLPNTPDVNIFNPIATTFNTTIINEGDSGGDGGDVDSVNVANTTNTGAYLTLGGTAADPIVQFNSGSLPTTTPAFSQVADTDGTPATATTFNDRVTFSIETDSEPFLDTTASGNGSNSKIEFQWKKKLFTSFGTDASPTSTIPQILQSICVFKGATNGGITTTGDNANIEFTLNSGTNDKGVPSEFYQFGSINTTSHDIGGTGTSTQHDANQVGDAIVFEVKGAAEATTGIDPNISRSLLQFKDPDTDADNLKLDFEINPAGHMGLGAQLVKITSSDGEAPIKEDEIGFYREYTVTAFFWSGAAAPEGTGSNDEIAAVTGQTLRDYSQNIPTATGLGFNSVRNIILDGYSSDEVTVVSQQWPLATVLLAQRVASNVYVTGTMPIMKVTCPS